jgi:hypothetical protein
MPDIRSLRKRHACVSGILPGLREDVDVCSYCGTRYPCDVLILAGFIAGIVAPCLAKISSGEVTGDEAAKIAGQILNQIDL